MKTFNVTKTAIPIVFVVDQDSFEAVPADKLPAGVLADYFQHITDGNLFKAHDEFFEAVLIEDSYKRFNERLNSKVNPITVSVLGDIAAWLIGDQYLGGKSYGRAQALIGFALDYWDEFDSWCLIHGINGDPWKLPSYRFGALVVAYMKDDKTPEGIATIDDSLSEADLLPHVFGPQFRMVVKAMCGVLAPSTSTTMDNVIYDSRLTELPVEERKRQEARAAGKPFRVPDWWKGERANYKVAKSMMGILPKKMGPIKE